MPDLSSLPADCPFLLLPVQVQVKFVCNPDAFVAAHPGRTAQELRIRLYPDQVGLNTHEPDLTAAELADGQTYWRTAPDAAAHTLHAIGPWRVLVGRYGASRALWIAQQTTPTNVGQLAAGTAPTFSTTAATQAARWTQPATSLAMPAYFTAILYEQVATDADITDPYVRQQLLPRLKAPYSPALVPDATTEFLRVARQVDGAPIADGPLQVGPDPQKDSSGLNDDAQLAWMVDFELALKQGLAIVVPLTDGEFRRGFKRLVVLGVREGASAEDGTAQLQLIFDNHLRTGGLALVPQGTPTNNTDGAGAGFSAADNYDADASFVALVNGTLFKPDRSGDWAQRADGQLFADALGLDADAVGTVGHGDGHDGREARLLNRALWPATYGYFLEQLLRPWFSSDAIEQTRLFFQDHVLGRGTVPAFRVHHEPYGVLTTTRFSAWQASSSLGSFGQQLLEVLRRLDVTWTERLNQAATYPAVVSGHVAAATTPPSQQNLLTTLSGDATSAEYYQRYMLGPNVVDSLNSHAQSQRQSIWPLVETDQPERPGQRTAGRFGTAAHRENPLYQEFLDFTDGKALGLNAKQWPYLFDQTFQSSFQLIAHTFADEPAGAAGRLGPVVDDAPLSETAPVQPFAGLAGGPNYVQWLATASFDAIRREDFRGLYGGRLPAGFAPPAALLYRLLRHAVLLRYWQAAADELNLPASARVEQELFNVVGQTSARWEILYQRVAGSSVRLHEALHQGQGPHGAQLVAYLQAVAALAALPTARLERGLAEHLDLGNYRLDAWKTALVAHRLAELRQRPTPGTHLGAFAWLEDLCPDDPAASAPSPEAQQQGQDDPDNLGYVHAPSLNHATTAAILRQGYKSRQHTVDASDPAANRMSLNLSSERVRKALAVLAGIRAGQSLAALLGQEFEQALAAHPGTVASRPYAYYLRNFRLRFPYADEKKLVDQPAPTTAAANETAARQVVDGLALAQAGSAAYPYGDSTLPTGSAAENAAFAAAARQEVDALLDTLDALGDLTVGESIYQAVMGNTEQAGAMLDSIAKGKFPVNPEVVHPRPASVSLTHRVLAHLPATSPAGLLQWGDPTPLARATPGLNRWLTQFFGSPSDILLAYAGAPTLDTAGNPGPPAAGTVALSVAALQPVDLLYLLDAESLRRGSTLDTYLRYAIAPDNPGAEGFEVDYATLGALTLRRLLPLAGRLRQLVAGSRPALPKDLQTTASAGATQATATLNETELTARFAGLLQTAQTLITALPDARQLLFPGGQPFGTGARAGGASTGTPPTLPTPQQLRPLLRQAAAFGVPEALSALLAPDEALLGSASQVRAVLRKRRTAAQQALAKRTAATAAAATAAAADANEVSAYVAAGEALFGPAFRLTVTFTLPGAAAGAYAQAVADTGLLRHHTANPLLMQEWLQGVATVRDPLNHLSKVVLLNDLTWDGATGHTLPDLQPAQLSAAAPTGAYWLGAPYPDTYAPVGDAVSLVQWLPAGYSATGPQGALWLDEWTELLLLAEQTTAVAFHYDQPNTSAPQSLLLVVAPDSETAPGWKFDHLLGAVNETLDLAKKRTVQPDDLAFTHLGTLLPALVAPVAQQGVTFTLDFRGVRQSARFQSLPLAPRAQDQ